MYGDVTDVTVFRAENMFPVTLATLIIAVGWVIVVEPNALFNLGLKAPAARTVASAPASPAGPAVPIREFRFAFLGAYFYILQMLVRRYFQNDLRTHAYVNATTRVIIVFLLTWVLSEVISPDFGRTRIALAFLVGVFPQVGLQVLVESAKLPFKGAVKSLESSYPLSDLDGLTPWYESHLLEQGIEDVQNLATAA